MEEKKIKIIRRIIAIIVLILFIAFFVKMLPQFINLTTEEGREAFQKNTEELFLTYLCSEVADMPHLRILNNMV